MNTTILTRFQKWYLTNCNGDWEHSFGISISTLDNPGWNIKADLSNTSLQNLEYDRQLDNGAFDWLVIKVHDNIFEASGDPTKLETILTIFLDEIIPSFSDPNFSYEVYVQL